MKFNNPWYENEELAYEDVFLFQNYFEGKSRFEMDVQPEFSLNANIPIVVANMNAVAGKRMAETMARYGGLVVLPQDMDTDTMKRIVLHIKNANVFYDTPITVGADDTIRDALGLIYKRDHQCVILVDTDNKPLALFKPKDFDGFDQFTLLGNLLKGAPIVAEDGISDENAFNLMEKNGIGVLPIVNKN
jgi:IMP dehydrogenase